MGQKETKLVVPEDGNLENEQVLDQIQKEVQRKEVKKALVFNDQQLFGEKEDKVQLKIPFPNELIKLSSTEQDEDEEDTTKLHEKQQTKGNDDQTEKEQQVKPVDGAPKVIVAENEKDKEETEEMENVADDAKNENDDDMKSAEHSALEKSAYAINYEHVKETISEYLDSVKPTDEHSGNKLLEIMEQLTFETDELSMWKGDYGSTISSKQDATSKMKSVTDFAENNSSCTPMVKTKLRVVTKLILEAGKDKYADYKGILLLIASHGNVCNVMKEVAINNAYGIMTGKLCEFIKSQTLKEQILSCLRDYRVLLVEECFHHFKFTNNTHYIAGFHNTMAEQIGVKPYNDPNICYPSSSQHPKWKENLDKRFFREFYTLQKVLNYIFVQIDEKKIGYQKIVQFFEENKPSEMESNEFLQCVINVDTGKISENYMCWLLQKMDILLIKDKEWKEIEKTW